MCIRNIGNQILDMAMDLNGFKMIDDYLMGEMTEEEKLSFEKKIKTDLDLEKEYELQKDLLGLMDLQEQIA